MRSVFKAAEGLDVRDPVCVERAGSCKDTGIQNIPSLWREIHLYWFLHLSKWDCFLGSDL